MRWTNEAWEVATEKAPILDTVELDKLEASLGIPMPEMVFGKNRLEIVHKPTQTKISIDPVEALDSVDKSYNGKTKILKVAHSDAWKASKIKHKKEVPPVPGQIDYDVDKVHRPFDWTYTTNYQCTCEPDRFAPTALTIPYEELKKPEPILFFDEVQLYEDELGDFGLATYTAKIRVMPNCLFVLARLYVRVDNVAFRIRDTRIFIDFATGDVIREYCTRESTYEEVKKKVPIWAEDFTQLLRDANWVASVAQLESSKNTGFNLFSGDQKATTA